MSKKSPLQKMGEALDDVFKARVRLWFTALQGAIKIMEKP